MGNQSRRFVNPYTFVPLPEKVVRADPPGHEGRGDLLSGTIKVTWELATPMLLPEDAKAEGWIASDGRVSVPGSSVKGMIRSVHEAMFNGCFRVVDQDFLPVHRQPTQAGSEGGWRLAVVSETRHYGGLSSAGIVRLCNERVIHVEAQAMKERWPEDALPTTGDVFKFDVPPEPDRPRSRGGREVRTKRQTWNRLTGVELVHREGDGVAVGQRLVRGGWVFIATEVIDARGSTPYWAAAEIGDERALVPPWVCEDFVRLGKGSEDLRVLMKHNSEGDRGSDAWKTEPLFATVELGGETLAERRLTTPTLFAGDVVWVKVQGSGSRLHVTDIKPSQVWRRLGGSLSVGDRMGEVGPESPHPCVPAEHGLCLSCATFGAVDAQGDRPDQGKQDAYAGHVRCSSAQSGGSVRLSEPFELAPQSSPKPSSGNFYLEARQLPRFRQKAGDMGSHWDSEIDVGAPRRIRGRKFYWHSDPEAQANSRQMMPRYRRGGEQSEEMGRSGARLVPSRTRLSAVIAFDQLDPVAARALVTAIDPRALLQGGGGEVAVRFGGGKAFGLGSATIVDIDVDARTSHHRYADPASLKSSAPQVTALEQFDVATVERAGGSSQLDSVARVLDRTALGAAEDLVTYPPTPGSTWSQADVKEFRQSFAWFAGARGEWMAEKRGKHGQPGTPAHSRPWVVLPDATDEDQSLPITPGGYS